MSRRFIRLLLLPVLMVSAEVWAIGLGDIKLDSALNEPLRAEITLLSATPDEIIDLKVSLASAETFARYGIDRPFYLQGVEFEIVNGGVAGSVVRLRSRSPITEPFLTFLVEANWPSGRLLREYTVLLDPPTYAPPAVQQTPNVEAPRRSAPRDSGRIERAAPEPTPAASQPRSAPQPSQPARTTATEPKPMPPADDVPYDTASNGTYVVARRDTLWGIASRMRPDSRLTMNQTMLAIFEANRDAFGGNINLLKEGASLRIPSADEVFRISRGDALSEVQRQHSAWTGSVATSTDTIDSEPSSGLTRPSLTLVPPDAESTGTDYTDDASTTEPPSREQEIEDRIYALESADVPNQQSLIEVRDNELAALRQELANLRGEVYEPPIVDTADDAAIDDTSAADEIYADDNVFVTDDTGEEVAADAITDTDDTTTAVDDATLTDDATTVVGTPTAEQKGLVEKILDFTKDYMLIIGGVLVFVIGLLFWFMRRGGDDDANLAPWESLDGDNVNIGALSSTESMQAPTPDDAIVVVEQDTGINRTIEQTIETVPPPGDDDDAGSFGSLEDTISSEPPRPSHGPGAPAATGGGGFSF